MCGPCMLTNQPVSQSLSVSFLAHARPRSVGSGPLVQFDELHRLVPLVRSDVVARSVEKMGEARLVLPAVARPLVKAPVLLRKSPGDIAQEDVPVYPRGCVLYGTCPRPVAPPEPLYVPLTANGR